MIDIRYLDERILVCIKPSGILSTDEEGGLPQLLQEQLGLENRPRTVHRLDRVVSGLIVLARGAKSASILSEQVMGRSFGKEYLAVIHGCPAEKKGTLTDLLGRDKARKMTYVADGPGKGIQEAVLDYEVLGRADGMSLIRIAEMRSHAEKTGIVNISKRGKRVTLKYDRESKPSAYAIVMAKAEFGEMLTISSGRETTMSLYTGMDASYEKLLSLMRLLREAAENTPV